MPGIFGVLGLTVAHVAEPLDVPRQVERMRHASADDRPLGTGARSSTDPCAALTGA